MKFFISAAIVFVAVLAIGTVKEQPQAQALIVATQRRTVAPIETKVTPAKAAEVKPAATESRTEKQPAGPSVTDLEATENLLSGAEPTEVAAGPVARIVERAVDKARRLKRCCVDCNCTGECNCSFPGECLINSATPANSIISITQCYGTHCETRTYKPRGEARGTWELGKAPGVKGWSKQVYHRANKVTHGTAPAYYAQPQQFFQPTYTRGFRGGCSTCR